MLNVFVILRSYANFWTPLSEWMLKRWPTAVPQGTAWLPLAEPVTVVEWLNFQWTHAALWGFAGWMASGDVMIGGGLAAAAWFLPRFWLKEYAVGYRRAVLRGLPDALDLLTACVEGGSHFDAAVAKVVEYGPRSPIRDGLARYLYEVSVGKSRQEALRDSAERLGVKEYRAFTAVVTQAERLGTSLAEGLKVQAEMLRVAWRQEMEKQALQAPVKLLFPLTFCIFPTTFLMIFGPVVLHMMAGF